MLTTIAVLSCKVIFLMYISSNWMEILPKLISFS